MIGDEPNNNNNKNKKVCFFLVKVAYSLGFLYICIFSHLSLNLANGVLAVVGDYSISLEIFILTQAVRVID